MEKFRLYIDESGTHSYSDCSGIFKRYLCLIGIAISEEEYINVLQPKIRQLKLMFADDPDDLPVLHREDIVNKKGCFSKLNNPDFKASYNSILLDIIENTNYYICSVVIDKTAHFEKYEKAAYHPYHYCLSVLLERYSFLLEEIDGSGDVMAEGRGKKENEQLSAAYKSFYNSGTYFRSTTSIQKRITSSSIKIKSKENKIEGLELADLLVFSSKLDILKSYKVIDRVTDNFCQIIIEKISKKYRKNPTGSMVIGYGKKLIQ